MDSLCEKCIYMTAKYSNNEYECEFGGRRKIVVNCSLFKPREKKAS